MKAGGGLDTNTLAKAVDIEKIKNEIKEEVEKEVKAKLEKETVDKEKRLLDEIERLKIANQQLEQQSKPFHVFTHIQQLPTYLNDDTLEVHSDEYTIVEEIDSGNFAKVYKGKHTKSSRDVVIKQVKGAAANTNNEKKFESEIKKIRFLAHPGIPKVEAFYRTNKDMCVVLQESNGLSVRYVMDENESTNKVPETVPSLLPSELVRLTTRLIEILDYVHSTGVIHYDIKPENILLCNSEYGLQLIDFGSAGFVSNTANTSNASTFNYASPEKLDDIAFDEVKRKKENMSKIDVWSAGATILNACCSALLVTRMYEDNDDIHPYFTITSLRRGYITLDDDTQVPWDLDLVLSKYFEMCPEAKTLWDTVDSDIKDIINVCLTRDISKRPFIRDITQRQSYQRLRNKV